MKKIFTILLIIVLCQSLAAAGRDNSTAEKLNQSGLFHLRNNKYPEAEICFRKAIAADPIVKYYYNNLAVTFMKQKKYHRAAASLEKCISIDPDHAKALSNLAISYFHLFEFRKAYGSYQRSLELDPEYTRERFSKKRTQSRIKKLQAENPDRTELEFILKYMGDK